MVPSWLLPFASKLGSIFTNNLEPIIQLFLSCRKQFCGSFDTPNTGRHTVQYLPCHWSSRLDSIESTTGRYCTITTSLLICCSVVCGQMLPIQDHSRSVKYSTVLYSTRTLPYHVAGHPGSDTCYYVSISPVDTKMGDFSLVSASRRT